MSEYKKRDAEQKGAKKQREIEEKLMRENLEGPERVKDHKERGTKITVVLPGGATKRFDIVADRRSARVVVPKGLQHSAKTRYEDVLTDLDLNPESVIVLKNGVPVPLDEVVEAGELRILKVVSGG